MVMYRMGVAGEKGAPAPAEQGAMLYNNWLFDIPKLLDLCVLFGHCNRELAAALVRAAPIAL